MQKGEPTDVAEVTTGNASRRLAEPSAYCKGKAVPPRFCPALPCGYFLKIIIPICSFPGKEGTKETFTNISCWQWTCQTKHLPVLLTFCRAKNQPKTSQPIFNRFSLCSSEDARSTCALRYISTCFPPFLSNSLDMASNPFPHTVLKCFVPPPPPPWMLFIFCGKEILGSFKD